MKETVAYITNRLGTKWYGFFLGWVVCVIKEHKWQLLDHWANIGGAHVGCSRCGATQFFEDVPTDWNGQYSSRSIDYFHAALTTVLAITIIALAVSVVIKLIAILR